MFIVHVHCSLFMFIVHCSHGATLIFDDVFYLKHSLHFPTQPVSCLPATPFQSNSIKQIVVAPSPAPFRSTEIMPTVQTSLNYYSSIQHESSEKLY